MKYKGFLINMPENHLYQEAMEVAGKDAVAEMVRSKLVHAMGAGKDTAVYFGQNVNSAESLPSLCHGKEWYNPEMLFTPTKIADESWYSKCLIKHEENKDAFGNQNCFIMKPNFKLSLLFEGKETDYVNFVNHHQLQTSQFVVIIVE